MSSSERGILINNIASFNPIPAAVNSVMYQVCVLQYYVTEDCLKRNIAVESVQYNSGELLDRYPDDYERYNPKWFIAKRSHHYNGGALKLIKAYVARALYRMEVLQGKVIFNLQTLRNYYDQV